MRIIISIMLIMTIVSNISEAVTGSVTATKLNIRVKPGTKYAVVAQLKKGDNVEIVSHDKEWYEIIAPSDTKVWVAADFIKDAKITKSVQLRSGPSVAYSSFGMIDAGKAVKIVDKSRNNWVRIAPPKSLTAWTSAKYIYLPPEGAAKLTGKKSVADLKAPKAKVDKTKKIVKDKIKTALPYTEGEEKQITVEGFLVTLSKDSTYVTHAIASRINGEYFPLCYVHSQHHNLKLWEGRRVNVTGMQRWVKNWQRPVVEVNKIAPAW